MCTYNETVTDPNLQIIFYRILNTITKNILILSVPLHANHSETTE